MSRDTTGSVGMPFIKNRWWLFDSVRMYDIRTDVLPFPSQRPTGQRQQSSMEHRYPVGLAGKFQESGELCLAVQRAEPLVPPRHRIHISQRSGELASD